MSLNIVKVVFSFILQLCIICSLNAKLLPNPETKLTIKDANSEITANYCTVMGTVTNLNHKAGALLPKKQFPKNWRVGMIRVGRSIISCIVYKENSKFYNRIIVDLDRDNDFTNNSIVKFDKEDSWAILKTALGKCDLQVKINHSEISIRPAQWFEGSVKLNSKMVKIAVVDKNLDGKYAYGDIVVVDKNGNNKFEQNEVNILEEFIQDGDGLLTSTISADGTKINIKQYIGKVVGLTIPKNMVIKHSEKLLKINLKTFVSKSKKQQIYTIATHFGNGKINVPAGKYMAFTVSVYTATGQIVYSSVRGCIKMQKTVLERALQIYIEPSAFCQNRKIVISRMPYTKNRGNVTTLYKLSATNSIDILRPPSFEIFKESDLENPIVQGDLRYG